MSFTKNPGRFAGSLYVVASIAGIFGLIYVPSKLIVQGDAAELLATSPLLRHCFVSGSQRTSSAKRYLSLSPWLYITCSSRSTTGTPYAC